MVFALVLHEHTKLWPSKVWMQFTKRRGDSGRNAGTRQPGRGECQPEMGLGSRTHTGLRQCESPTQCRGARAAGTVVEHPVDVLQDRGLVDQPQRINEGHKVGK